MSEYDSRVRMSSLVGLTSVQIVAEIETILERLRAEYPGATYELDWSTPEQMLVATTLAAQCTDERVNRVTKTLFVKYPDPKAFAEADYDELANDLRPTGFYKQKARSVQTINRALVERFGGTVPRTMRDLTSIKGIARKTANVVLNCCFDQPSGVIVDVHVARVSQRMGLSKQKKPEKIEQDLMRQVPKDAWTFWGPAMVLVGRYTCLAKAPKCAECPFLDLCPRKGVGTPRPEPKPRKGVRTSKGGRKPAEGQAAASTPATGPVVDAWVERLVDEIDQDYVLDLLDFVEKERADHQVFPPAPDVFSAFTLTSFEQIKVVVLGQDPYHDDGQAHGLSFSVMPGVSIPPSLRNIYKELKSDMGIEPPSHGHLIKWAEQGVMLLNTVLTVQAHKANSHRKRGWERFTDAAIKAISRERDHVVFVLWGKPAQKKKKIIDANKHTVIEANHPSPLSARKGFFGSKPFSKANAALEKHGQSTIDWRL